MIAPHIGGWKWLFTCKRWSFAKLGANCCAFSLFSLVVSNELRYIAWMHIYYFVLLFQFCYLVYLIWISYQWELAVDVWIIALVLSLWGDMIVYPSLPSYQLMLSDLYYKLYDSERRQAEAARIREKYPDRIPVRCSFINLHLCAYICNDDISSFILIWLIFWV